MAEKDPKAVERGRKRWQGLTPEERSAVAALGHKAKMRRKLSVEQQRQIAQIDANASLDKDRVVSPGDYFSPEETARRFNALLTCASHTPPTPLCPACGAATTWRLRCEDRRRPAGRSVYRCKCGRTFTLALPVLHEMNTEEMEVVAEEKERGALANRYVLLTGRGGGALSELLQAAVRARGWLVNQSGHGLMPRVGDADAMWRRFLAFLPQLDVAKHASRLKPDEQAAIVAYQGPITKLASNLRPRKAPELKPPRRARARHDPGRIEAAAMLCVEAGFSMKEAAAEHGVSTPAVRDFLRARRARGEPMGLTEEGTRRARSNINAARRGVKRPKGDRE